MSFLFELWSNLQLSTASFWYFFKKDHRHYSGYSIYQRNLILDCTIPDLMSLWNTVWTVGLNKYRKIFRNIYIFTSPTTKKDLFLGQFYQWHLVFRMFIPDCRWHLIGAYYMTTEYSYSTVYHYKSTSSMVNFKTIKKLSLPSPLSQQCLSTLFQHIIWIWKNDLTKKAWSYMLYEWNIDFRCE